MNEISKFKHAAGGYQFRLSKNGNTKFGKEKKELIIKALKDSNTEGVYQLANGKIKIQLLNGLHSLY